MTSDPSQGHHAPLSELEALVTSEQAIWRQTEWGEMRVGYETYLSDFDDSDLLRAFPDQRCPCPHWGYLLAGRMRVRYADHEDVVKPGELYYMAPGHSMTVDAGTVLIEFSPKEEFRRLTEIAEQGLSTSRT